MDTQALQKHYMDEYNDLTLKFEELKINDLVDDLNKAISRSDITLVNNLYNKVLEWNSRVEKLEETRVAIDSQYPHLHLPSPTLFIITLDGEEKVWRFNVEDN